MAVTEKGTDEYVDLNLYDDMDNIVISNPAHLFLQEIELAVKIGINEIWGMTDYIDLRRYLFSQYITLIRIQNDISTYISSHCAHSAQFDWSVEVEIFKDDVTGKELLHIRCTVNDVQNDGEVKKYVQKFAIL